MSLPFLPTVLWQSVPFGDKDAFLDWQMQHFLHHQALAVKTSTPWFGLDDLRQDTFGHALIHHRLSASVGIADIWNFAGYDLNDRASYDDFMLSHSQAHQALQSSAGL